MQTLNDTHKTHCIPHCYIKQSKKKVSKKKILTETGTSDNDDNDAWKILDLDEETKWMKSKVNFTE